MSRDGSSEPVQAGVLEAGDECPRHRVLLIDDHAPLAEATAAFMQAKGLDVRIASTGEEALRLAAAFQPAIILCDLRLPDMPGLDVVRALRATAGGKDALIAIHTAMTESDLRALKEEAETSVDVCLSKPLTPDKLAMLLSKLQALRRSAPARSTVTELR